MRDDITQQCKFAGAGFASTIGSPLSGIHRSTTLYVGVLLAAAGAERAGFNCALVLETTMHGPGLREETMRRRRRRRNTVATVVSYTRETSTSIPPRANVNVDSRQSYLPKFSSSQLLVLLLQA